MNQGRPAPPCLASQLAALAVAFRGFARAVIIHQHLRPVTSVRPPLRLARVTPHTGPLGRGWLVEQNEKIGVIHINMAFAPNITILHLGVLAKRRTDVVRIDKGGLCSFIIPRICGSMMPLGVFVLQKRHEQNLTSVKSRPVPHGHLRGGRGSPPYNRVRRSNYTESGM